MAVTPRHPKATLQRGSGSLSTYAYGRIKAAIQAHEFKPGERMRESELAEWLEVSRTPMRDALLQLESEGLLEAAPRRGLVVATLDQQQVSEIYALREMLEGLAARLAALNASTAEASALGENLEKQAEASDGDGPTSPDAMATLARLNEQFHGIIYGASRNRYLVAALQALETPLALLPGTTYSGSDRPGEALAQHRRLVAAIAGRRGDEAEQIAREHIQAAERIRLRMLMSHSDPEPHDTPTAGSSRPKSAPVPR